MAALGACSLLSGVQGALDRDGRLENGAGGVDSGQPGPTSGKVVATTDVLCAGGAGSCFDNFVVSLAVAHMVQGVVRVEKSPTTSHWPVRLTLKGTTWGHNVLARQRTSPFQEEPFEWTWETPDAKQAGAGLVEVAS